MTDKLKIAIVHYHLRTGGVRRVIDNTLEALKGADIQPAIITGQAFESENSADIWGNTPIGVVSELQYSDNPGPGLDAKIVGKLMETARNLLGAVPDIWHFHNHSLGKNTALPSAVWMLAEKGYPMLLQIHDFAEDGRPELYNSLVENLTGNHDNEIGKPLYPRADHVHYALINSRDTEFVRQAGAGEHNVHLLPNPVSFGNAETADFFDKTINPESDMILYPTRAIRRKNVGEVLLWAALEGDDFQFGLTRGPKNPVHQRVYQQWVALAEEFKLPVEFELGEQPGADFERLIAGANSIITTSVTEGFGLCFLEPFLAGKPLCGRTLPEITRDFESRDIDIAHLYSTLRVPLELIGENKLKTLLKSTMSRYYANYRRDFTPEVLNRTLESFILNGGKTVDFGRLDETLQKVVITAVVNDKSLKKEISPAGLRFSGPQSVIDNRKRVIHEFSIEKYGERLSSLYKIISSSAREDTGTIDSLSSRSLLDSFLAPERFSLLKT